MVMAEQENSSSKVQFVKGDGFSAKYANNVQFENTIWDLTIVFGELARPRGGTDVQIEQHTSVTLSWLQAKLMAVFLLLNVNQYEASNGAIRVPRVVLPPHITDEESTLLALEMMTLAIQRTTEQVDTKNTD
jgi:hypothetical protein